MTNEKRYCVFHMAGGSEPAWHDGDTDLPITYATREEAVEEILTTMEEHIRQIRDGDRDFDDGIGFEDWIEEVYVTPDGTVICEDGRTFGKRG